MSNHPNRGPKGPTSNPAPEEVAAARAAAGLTQRQAADLVRGTEAAWRAWESGLRRMPPGLWELFNLKTGKFMLPEFITEEFLDSILPDHPEHRPDVAFLAHAYYGMARHPYLSADWIAHNFMWAEIANRVSAKVYGQPGKDQTFTRPIVERFRANNMLAN